MHPYQLLLAQFETYFAEATPAGAPRELYEPIGYIMQLGGKRMRPLLTLAGCHLFDGEVANALPVAYAVELFHNFSLVHDDIMDNAALRRGKATVHEQFGTNTAILSGDVMLVYVYEKLLLAPTQYILNIVKIFNDTAIKVCEGQQLDMNFETRDDVTVDEYVQMISFKTAVLLACSLQCGAIIAGVSQAHADMLYQYGLHMGIAFQIQDDLLDTFGGKGFGKEIGGDIKNNKKTYLLIKARELATGDDKLVLERQLCNFDSPDEKVKIVTELFIKLRIKQLAEQLMHHHHQEALNILADIPAEQTRKDLLQDYANALLVRQV